MNDFINCILEEKSVKETFSISAVAMIEPSLELVTPKILPTLDSYDNRKCAQLTSSHKFAICSEYMATIKHLLVAKGHWASVLRSNAIASKCEEDAKYILCIFKPGFSFEKMEELAEDSFTENSKKDNWNHLKKVIDKNFAN